MTLRFMTEDELTALRKIAVAAVDMCENGVWSGGSVPHIWRCHPRWADALVSALMEAGYVMDAQARDEGTDIGFGRQESPTYQARRDTIAQLLWLEYEDEDYKAEWPDVGDIRQEYEDQAEKLLHAAGVMPDGNEVERMRAALLWIVENVDAEKAPLVVGRAKAALR